MEQKIAIPVNIQKDENSLWINGQRYNVGYGITTYRDMYDVMKAIGKEVLPEEVRNMYDEILTVGTIFIRGLK